MRLILSSLMIIWVRGIHRLYTSHNGSMAVSFSSSFLAKDSCKGNIQSIAMASYNCASAQLLHMDVAIMLRKP